ncbi:protein D2 [Folsomia candida]|uniref:protein D2 n=1 Tax=Folsomia candida TaxID=158441 RepID=UPI000B8FDFDA|nr:protein D2 [Folsomia candida]XP_021965116.1 protein D2 [Folsomia candida]XP_021965121.1 protein D2 [Folsomia candida]
MDWETPVANFPLKVVYSDGVEVQNGNRVTRTQAGNKPSVSWNADPNKTYLLAMMDPDAPSRYLPFLGEVLHWMVINVKGGNVTRGEEVVPYGPPGPPPGLGAHRYVFLVYEQPELITVDEQMKTSRLARIRYSIQDFAKKHNLGNPVAKNYFQTTFF